jgi:hypothetical protein
MKRIYVIDAETPAIGSQLSLGYGSYEVKKLVYFNDTSTVLIHLK